MFQGSVQCVKHFPYVPYVGFDRLGNVGTKKSNVGGDYKKRLQFSCRTRSNVDKLREF